MNFNELTAGGHGGTPKRFVELGAGEEFVAPGPQSKRDDKGPKGFAPHDKLRLRSSRMFDEDVG